MSDRELGRVVALWRYPVKSMAGESLPSAEVTWHGLAGDRRWAFVRDDQVRSGFPYFTLRERADLARFVPRLEDPAQPDRSAVWVRTPHGVELDVADPALAAELGAGVRPLKLSRGLFDALPLSLLTTSSVAELGARVGQELDVRRFRPNLVVETTEGPFAEDAWVGRELRIGGLRMRVDRRDQRCVVVGLDPDTGASEPAVLGRIVRERDACFGVYGSVVEPGLVRVGDPVTIES